MNGYSPKDIIRESKVLVAPSAEIVSEDTGLTAGGALNGFRVMFTAVSVSGSITYKLQVRTLDAWTDVAGANASVTVSADGEGMLKQLALISADQPNFPMGKQIRVSATGAGSATITKMVICQEL